MHASQPNKQPRSVALSPEKIPQNGKGERHPSPTMPSLVELLKGHGMYHNWLLKSWFGMGVVTTNVIGRLSRRKRCTILSNLFRDIFGNLFYPITLAPSWLTPDVKNLAQSIYDDRYFDRLPILADELEKTGCDSQEILAHCRGPGPHVRGCRVVDRVLGKE